MPQPVSFGFRYHPDPIATGSVVESDKICVCCDQARGHIYVGPTYAEEELEDCICPWCIVNGAAHDRYAASFVDPSGVGGYGDWDEVCDSTIEMIAYRTAGFSGWQQERWWTHCSDGALFLGPVGWSELQAFGPEAIEVFRTEAMTEMELSEADAETYVKALNKDGGPTGYLFRCRQCGKLGGYSDSL